MKQHRWTAAATAVTVITGLSALTGTVTPAAAQQNATGYAALGDSYSAGVGAGSYDPGSNGCKRSDKAYPQLWRAAHSPSSFDFTACSGARTTDVIDGQLAPLDETTGLVTVSAGGNDAGFGDTMSACVTQGEAACLDKTSSARDYITNTLPGKLDALYDAIRGKAPSARVVVLGYPRIYQTQGSCKIGLTEKARTALNAASDDLSSVIAERAGQHGFNYGDVRQVFDGHGVCSGNPWLHSVTLPVDESYHPTSTGQSDGYLPVLNSTT